MKQGTRYLKFIFMLLLAVLVCYLIFSALTSVRAGITTATAIPYEVGDGLTTTGFVLRDERLITSNYAINVLTRKEGEKVSAGGVVATVYRDENAKTLQGQIDELDEQITQLEYVYNAASATQDNAALDVNILNDIKNLNVNIARGNFASADSMSAQMRSEILRRYLDVESPNTLQNKLTQLRNQRSDLTGQMGGNTDSITTDVSGIFSSAVDGYETVLSYDKIEKLTVSGFQSLEQQEVAPDDSAIGKIITSDIWYYATVAPEEQVEGIRAGDRLTVTFSYDFYEDVTMTVAHLSQPEDGKRVLVLSCGDFLTQATGLRAQTADIIFESYSGLRVPKQAVYYSEETGSAGVYVLEGRKAVWKDVTILYDNGESYVAQLDKKSIDNLWPGDEIIVTNQELFDGKVVK